MENSLASGLKANGITITRYPEIFGSPDFILRDSNLVIFVDGCFWHRCPKCYRAPKSKRKFWASKIKRNMRRDREVNRALKTSGYRIIRFWEHEIQENLTGCIGSLASEMKRGDAKRSGRRNIHVRLSQSGVGEA
jgi:DNA mismatch endonuclease (patch repair protein)